MARKSAAGTAMPGCTANGELWSYNAPVVEDGMQANMKVTKVDAQIEGMKISVPAFTTAADLDEGDELLIYVADRKRGLEAGPLTRTIAFL